MAEFKLNRLKYTWKGTWNQDTIYYNDDIVRVAGSTYVCIAPHTSTSAFYTDLTTSQRWVKMTDGYTWRGSWISSRTYNQGDIALYAGALYLTITPHTSSSNFDTDVANWSLYVSNIRWRGDWETARTYGVGDTVRYGGTVYICTDNHVSGNTAAGLEADTDKWTVYFEGLDYLEDWQANTRYKEKDLVLFSGGLYSCTTAHTSSSSFDESNWTPYLFGFQFDSDWSSSTHYGIGSVVRSGGYLYYCVKNNVNKHPIDSIYQVDPTGPYWEILTTGIRFLGDWQTSTTYRTGDVVRRGGILYVAILDSVSDGSTLDYLDVSNWEVISQGLNHKGIWSSGSVQYAVGDTVLFFGNVYRCNYEHVSAVDNHPTDANFNYWDELIRTVDNIGLNDIGDLLNFGFNEDDDSSLSPAPIRIGDFGALLAVGENNKFNYRRYQGNLQRVFYVTQDGLDNPDDANNGKIFSPFKTIRYACEKADDGFEGFTTIRVATGRFVEIGPIIIPVRTAVVGAELRSTEIAANTPITALALDATYTIAVLSRISGILPSLFNSEPIIKSQNNLSDQVLRTDLVFSSSASLITSQELISDIISYINFFINSTGTNPTLTGSNTARTDQDYLNAIAILQANSTFLQDEAVAFVRQIYPEYEFNSDLCRRDTRRYIESIIYDLRFPGNYKSLLAARYYRNAVLGSTSDDMFYLRDATGLRNCTLTGLSGVLSPPNVFDLYRTVTAGAYCSLDPGWGPADSRCWISTRSPYIQNVTTIGNGCIGQKIDGALHNGGNKSMVSNDFTQVLSDGIGAWVSNNGRAELVSVFTYYCHVGYLAKNGGIIRGTNGNCSYGRFGAVADSVDANETPRTAVVNNRVQEASVAAVFAGEFTDEIQIFEWENAGQNYTQAIATIVGSGISASTVFDDFRDDAVFEARLIDTSTNPLVPNTGGGGYSVQQNNAQVHLTPGGDFTSITIASNDPNFEADYLGKRIIIVSGKGTGQYGYITGYDDSSKGSTFVINVSRESDGFPGWDHIVPGTPSVAFDTSTAYRIEPRVTFSAPEYNATEFTFPSSGNWISTVYGETTRTFNNISAGAGTGTVVTDDGLSPITATFNITKSGRTYDVAINNPGAGYEEGQTLTVLGTSLGGYTPYNDLIITVETTSNDSTNSIQTISFTGIGASGNFVALTNGLTGTYSRDGDNWESFTMPSSGEWASLASGNNRFVAIRKNSNLAAISLDGVTWTSTNEGSPITLPTSAQWSSLIYGEGKFVAISSTQSVGAYSEDGITWTSMSLPTGDSTFSPWIDIAYGKGKFVALSNASNLSAYSEDGITWVQSVMDVIDDSSQKDWVSIAYGNNRFVAISSQGNIAYSFDGTSWLAGDMPTQDGSTAHNWKKIRYGQGVFFAVGDTGGRAINADPVPVPTNFTATSFDGVTWTVRELASTQQWNSISFGNPFIDTLDSSVGKNTPMWIAVAENTNVANKIRTGARALGRVEITSGVVTKLKLWDTGSSYQNPPTVTLTDPNRTSNAPVSCRLADGVLTNPSWISRGTGYRTRTTEVTITGNGFAEVYPVGKFVVLDDLERLPSVGSQVTFSGNNEIYQVVTIEPLVSDNDLLRARIRVSPELATRDNLEHGTSLTIRERYSQIRISGHDFLDVGTGNFIETNYPTLYSQLFVSAPENEVVEEEGGRVFYTSTDQSGNFRTGELFAVEQATGIVTISADFFDLSGLTELRLGGIRLGGTGAVIREFSTDPLFTEDSNNIVPTQRAIAAYLENRLTVGGSEIATASFIAGLVFVGPDQISNTINTKIVFDRRVDFDQEDSAVTGSILAQSLFHSSFGEDV